VDLGGTKTAAEYANGSGAVTVGLHMVLDHLCYAVLGSYLPEAARG
jgi:hypothetical protein